MTTPDYLEQVVDFERRRQRSRRAHGAARLFGAVLSRLSSGRCWTLLSALVAGLIAFRIRLDAAGDADQHA